MERFELTTTGDLLITPSATSAQTDFDFFIGHWTVLNKKLNSRLTDCNEWTRFDATDEDFRVLEGVGNINRFRASFDGKPFEGLTLRLFNQQTRLWSLYWADSNTGSLDTPVVGSFEGNTGQFYTKDVYQGKDIIMKFNWDKTEPDHPVWSQAFSPDNGKTWEWNWYMFFTRIK